MNIFSRAFSLIKAAVSGMKPVWQTYQLFASGKVFARKDYYYGIVYSCIDAIATNVASVGWSLQQVNKDGTMTEVRSHELIDVLRRPNAFMTWHDFAYTLSSHIDAFGKGIVYPVKNGNGKLSEIWALDPSRVRTKLGPNFIDSYIYINPMGEWISFAPDELIEVRRPNPFLMQEGISTIEMAKFAVESDYGAQEWNLNFFKNGAQPSGVLTTENTMSDLTFKRVREQFHDSYEGSGNAHKTLVLEGGLKFQQVALRQKDMDFLEQRKFNRDEILSIFKVPKPIVAISDDVNRASAETSEYVFAKRTVLPRLELIFEKLNEFLLPLVDTTGNLMLCFDNPVPDDVATKQAYYSAGWGKWLTTNDIRDEENLDTLEGGDELYISDLLMPMSSLADAVPPTTPPADGTEPPKKSRQKSVGDRKYMIRKRKFLQKKKILYTKELRQHFAFLVRDIRAHQVAGTAKANKRIGKTKGVEDILSKIMPSLTNWKGLYSSIVLDYSVDTYNEASSNASQSFNIPTVTADNAIAYLKNEATQAGVSQQDTILNVARGVIADQLGENEIDLETIKQAIADTINEQTDWRVERIARTELADAYTQGSKATYIASGVVEQWQWVVNEPEDDCADNEGEVRAIGETFSNGATEPPAHPNCQCDTLPYFGD